MAFASLKDKRMDPSIKPQTLIGDESIEDVGPSAPKPQAGVSGVAPQVPPAVARTLARSQGETVATVDARGRSLKLRRVGPGDRMRLFKILGPDGSKIEMLLTHAMAVTAVVAVDDVPQPFPKNERDLLAFADFLGDDGLIAAGTAYTEHFGLDEAEFDKDAIKN